MAVTVHADRTGLRVDLSGWDAVWALRRQVNARASQVLDAQAVPRADTPPLGLRLPGTYVPRLVTAGAYRHRDHGWAFWCVYRAPRVLRVTLTDHRFRHLVLQVADPDEAAARIREACGHAS